MVKLPDSRVLGGLPSSHSGRTPARQDTADIIEFGGQQLARGVGQAAQGIKQWSDRRDNYQIAAADAEYVIQKQNLHDQLKDEHDPDGLERKYTPLFDKAAEYSGQMIANPQARAMWEARRRPDFNSSKIAIGDRAEGLYKDRRIAGANESLLKLRQQGLKGDSQQAIEAAGNLISSLRETGDISATKAQELRESWVQDFSVAKLEIMEPGQRLAVLNDKNGIASTLPEDARVKLVRAAKRTIEAEENKRKVLAKLEYADRKDKFELAIKTGQIDDEKDILDDVMLDDGDKAVLLGKFRVEDKRRQDTIKVENILAGNGAINIYENDDRKALDSAYQKVIEVAGEENKILAAKQFIENSSYVPDALVADIRSGLISPDDSTALQSLSLAKHALEVNPNAFAGRAGDKGVQDAVDTFNAFVNQGYSEKQALERYQATQDREIQAKRKVVLEDTETKKWIKEHSTPNEVQARFDRWGITPARQKPDFVSDEQGLAIAGEYKRILEDAIVDVGGDRDAAQEVAKARLGRIYGVSNLNLGGDNILMRRPPEKYWPKVNRSHDYVTKELKELVSQYEGVEIDEVFLQADDYTEKDIKAGNLPRYQIWFKDENNIVQMVPGGHFRPDLVKANKEAPKPRDKWEQKKAGKQALEQFNREYGFGRKEGDQ